VLSGIIIITIQRLVCYFDIRSTFSAFILLLLPSKYPSFDGCGLQRLGAYASTENVRSQRALAKVGFTREGTLRAYHRFGGRAHDVHVYALLRAEFSAGPLAGVPATVAGDPPAAFSARSAARPS